MLSLGPLVGERSLFLKRKQLSKTSFILFFNLDLKYHYSSLWVVQAWNFSFLHGAFFFVFSFSAQSPEKQHTFYFFSGLVDKVSLILLSYIFQSLDVQLYLEPLVPAPVPSRTVNTWIVGLIIQSNVVMGSFIQTWILVFVSLA